MDGLYKFSKLEARLKKDGFKIEHNGAYIPIVRELSIDEQFNNIRFEDEGVVYTDENGREWLGFVYKKYKHLGNGGVDNYPRMHLCRCGVTDTWGEEAYFFANTLPIRCYDTSDDNKVKELDNIVMCKNCIPIRKNNRQKVYKDARQYVRYIKSLYKLEEKSEVTRWGYSRDWHKVRHDYLEAHGYYCENCGTYLGGIFHRSCLYVYHVDRDFANNNYANLRCLCVDCYMKAPGVEVTEDMKIRSRSLHDYQEGRPAIKYSRREPYELSFFDQFDE